MNHPFGESIPLPQGAGSLLWAELEIQRSAAGNIIQQLYKSPHVFQIVPELGEAGFLISPLVQNNVAFGKLYQGQGYPGGHCPID